MQNIGFSIDVNCQNPDSGKHKFFIRLAKEFIKLGICINNYNPEIYLRLPLDKVNKKAKINVLRLDGLIMNKDQDYKNKNKKILKSINESDAIIYQSKFCYKAYHNFLGVNKKFEIIYNGADPEEFLPRKIENFFLANCKWRPHKRLKYIIKSFLLSEEMGLHSKLIITGNPDYKIKHKHIRYVGWQNGKDLKILLSQAIANIHLAWIDWCPNSVIESVVAACPLIYTNSGGNKEISDGFGIEINDTPWDYKACYLYKPPPIILKDVAKAMIKIKKEPLILKSMDKFDIKNIALKYISFFDQLL